MEYHERYKVGLWDTDRWNGLWGSHHGCAKPENELSEIGLASRVWMVSSLKTFTSPLSCFANSIFEDGLVMHSYAQFVIILCGYLINIFIKEHLL
jgi:hypothetical protein